MSTPTPVIAAHLGDRFVSECGVCLASFDVVL